MTVDTRSRNRLSALFGGFGLTTIPLWLGHFVPVTQGFIALMCGVLWIVGALTAGALYPKRWGAAAVGVVSSIAALFVVDAVTIHSQGGEWSSLDKMVWQASLVVGGAIGIGLVGGSAWATSNPESNRPLGALVAAVGALAAAALAISVLGLTAWPARTSFTMSLPDGWNVIPREPIAGAREEHGTNLTALLGSSAPEHLGQPDGWPQVPVVGVSVTRGSGDPERCYRTWDGWPASVAQLHNAPPLEHGRVAIPAGEAYRIVRGEREGARVYAYGIERQRMVGAVREPVCYLLVVTVPDAGTLGESDVDAIAEGFAFR